MSSADAAAPLPRLIDTLRLRKLRFARGALVLIGSLIMVLSIGFFIFAEDRVQREFHKLGVLVPPGELARAMLIERVFQAAQAGLGLILIILGLLIYRAPLFCSITALCLFAFHWGVAIVINPTYLVKGAYVRLLVILALTAAIQTAYGYHRSLARSQAAGRMRAATSGSPEPGRFQSETT